MSETALEAEKLTRRFGGLHALQGVSFKVRKGEIHGIIGPNGAGKTTLLNLLSGTDRPTSGTYRLFSEDVTRWPVHRIVHEAGAVRTFQTVRLFDSMTVLENLTVAAGTAPRRHRLRRSGAAAGRRAVELVERLGLGGVAHSGVGGLSYGLRRKVEIGRALVTGPRLLLLDEPAAGLNGTERAELGGLLRELRAEGLTTILVEHQMDLVSSTCETLTVLDFGEVICAGPTKKVIADPRVLSAYLGEPHHPTSEISLTDLPQEA